MNLGLGIGINRQRGVLGVIIPPSLTGTIPAQSWVQGATITPFNVAAYYIGTGPFEFALAPGSAAMPAGLFLSIAGLITGLPSTVAAAVGIIIRATAPNGAFVDGSFNATVTVAPAAAPTAGATIGAQTFPAGTLIFPINLSSLFVGSNIVVTLAGASPALPAGLTIMLTDGVYYLSGVPTTPAGSVALLFNGANGTAPSLDRGFSVTISAAESVPASVAGFAWGPAVWARRASVGLGANPIPTRTPFTVAIAGASITTLPSPGPGLVRYALTLNTPGTVVSAYNLTNFEVRAYAINCIVEDNYVAPNLKDDATDKACDFAVSAGNNHATGAGLSGSGLIVRRNLIDGRGGLCKTGVYIYANSEGVIVEDNAFQYLASDPIKSFSNYFEGPNRPIIRRNLFNRQGFGAPNAHDDGITVQRGGVAAYDNMFPMERIVGHPLYGDSYGNNNILRIQATGSTPARGVEFYHNIAWGDESGGSHRIQSANGQLVSIGENVIQVSGTGTVIASGANTGLIAFGPVRNFSDNALVVPANQRPGHVTLALTASPIPENQPAGTVLGQFTIIDINGNGAAVTLTDNAGGTLAVNGANQLVATSTPIVFATTPTLNFAATATDATGSAMAVPVAFAAATLAISSSLVMMDFGQSGARFRAHSGTGFNLGGIRPTFSGSLGRFVSHDVETPVPITLNDGFIDMDATNANFQTASGGHILSHAARAILGFAKWYAPSLNMVYALDAISGTGVNHLFNDSEATRVRLNTLAMVNYLEATYGAIDIVNFAWFGDEGPAYANYFQKRILPFTGTLPGGATHVLGQPNPDDGGGYPVDGYFFDATATPGTKGRGLFVNGGPHMGFSVHPNETIGAPERGFIDDFVTDSRLAPMTKGKTNLTPMSGHVDSNLGIEKAALALITSVPAILDRLGNNYKHPEIVNVISEPTGAYFDYIVQLFNANDETLTTTRGIYNNPTANMPMPGSPASHHNDVFGVEWLRPGGVWTQAMRVGSAAPAADQATITFPDTGTGTLPNRFAVMRATPVVGFGRNSLAHFRQGGITLPGNSLTDLPQLNHPIGHIPALRQPGELFFYPGMEVRPLAAPYVVGPPAPDLFDFTVLPSAHNASPGSRTFTPAAGPSPITTGYRVAYSVTQSAGRGVGWNVGQPILDPANGTRRIRGEVRVITASATVNIMCAAAVNSTTGLLMSRAVPVVQNQFVAFDEFFTPSSTSAMFINLRCTDASAPVDMEIRNMRLT